MSADILLADFKSRNYTKLKPEDLLPVIEITEDQVNALSVVGELRTSLFEHEGVLYENGPSNPTDPLRGIVPDNHYHAAESDPA